MILPEGCFLQKLSPHHDKRGFFMEVFRQNGFYIQQVSVSKTHEGFQRGLHWHEKQTDIFCCLQGCYDVTLFSLSDNLTYSITLDSFDPHYLIIPPRIAHGYKSVRGEGLMLYLTSRIYDPTDEHVIDFNSLR